MIELDIATYLSEKKELVDRELRHYFSDENQLFDAMYYSLGSGKRIRPILMMASYEACGGTDLDRILPIACGLELIHTYSLIHDDLPAMDNDDFRRGKLSAHKKFGEATAILSGDGLFAYAFELFTRGNGLSEQKCAVIKDVSEAVGPKGVVYGQVLDISNDNGFTPPHLRRIHLHKTAKFIAVALKCGALMASVSDDIVTQVHNAGVFMGMLFQYTDDILDVIGKRENLGKTPGKDVASGKLTAYALYGLEGARYRAHRFATLAKTRFSALGERFNTLCAITDFILNRTY